MIMSEKNIAPHSIENEEQSSEERLELISFQMRDIVTTPGYGPTFKEDATAIEKTKQLSDWAKTSDIDMTLEGIQYYEDERTDANLKLVKLGLMTPYFVYGQHARDHGKDTFSKEELIEYRETLHEAILANPDLKATDFAESLQSTVLKSDLPESYRFSSGSIIEGALNGARGELIVEQIALSEAAKAAGITYEDSSVEEDARGIDFYLIAPIQRGNSVINVKMPGDVKFNLEQVSALQDPDEAQMPYTIKNGKVILWPGTSKEDFKGTLLLSQAAVEEKAKKMVPFLHMAAEEYYDYLQNQRRIRQNIGRRGVRSA